jgi:hypothetical protein
VVSQSAEERNCESFRLATHPAVLRIQLNFAFRRAAFSLSELEAAIRSVSIPVITQEHGANEGVSLALKAPNHQVLFDASGGRGIETSEWLPPLDGKICGFAGGLGPETLSRALPVIKQVALTNPSRSIWKPTSGTRTTGSIWMHARGFCRFLGTHSQAGSVQDVARRQREDRSSAPVFYSAEQELRVPVRPTGWSAVRLAISQGERGHTAEDAASVCRAGRQHAMPTAGYPGARGQLRPGRLDCS